MTNNKNESLEDIARRRNLLVQKMFEDCDLRIRLIGEIHKPLLVFDELVFLSAYVHNFNLIFLTTPTGSIKIGIIKIRKRHGMTQDKLMRLIREGQHRAVLKIRQFGTDLCLVGSNYRDRPNKEGKYPVFAKYDHKVYYENSRVADMVVELNDEGHKVYLWVPALRDTQDLNIVLNGVNL